MTAQIDSIADILADFKRGEMVILVDDAARENEGDLVVAAERVTAQHINFMAAHGRGLICLTLSEARCAQLDLPLMVSRNTARQATNFTVSIEAARGVTTGISARDRAVTVQAAVRAGAGPDDLVSPGHIFPIKAQPGGVLTRAGHTEAGSDLARLCGFEPAAVICEILNPDGSMARLPDLIAFGRAHGIRIGAIADLIRYRLENEPTVLRVAAGELRLRAGRFASFVYRDVVEGGVHLALVHGEIRADRPTPVRVHVHRGLLDAALESAEAPSWPLPAVLEAIAAQDCGVVVLLSYHESAEQLAARMTVGAGDGVDSAAVDAAADSMNATVDATAADSMNATVDAAAAAQQTAGVAGKTADSDPANLRMLGAGGQILADLGVGKVIALGRARRAHGLSGFGLEIVSYVADRAQLARRVQSHA